MKLSCTRRAGEESAPLPKEFVRQSTLSDTRITKFCELVVIHTCR